MSDKNTAGLALVDGLDNLFEEISPTDESTVAGGGYCKKGYGYGYGKYWKRYYKKSYSSKSYSKKCYYGYKKKYCKY